MVLDRNCGLLQLLKSLGEFLEDPLPLDELMLFLRPLTLCLEEPLSEVLPLLELLGKVTEVIAPLFNRDTRRDVLKALLIDIGG